MAGAAVVEGIGLHSGAPCRVTMTARPGPVGVRSGGVEVPVTDLVVTSTARATNVEGAGGSLRLGTVEHAFAALAGLGLYEGLALDVEGPEMPLLDGGAEAWCAALQSLGLQGTRPPLRVTREAVLEVGPSRFELCPGDAIDVSVHLVFEGAPIVAGARWTGDAADFVRRIAPARTFALAAEIEEIARRGLARHVEPDSVVIVTRDRLLWRGRPAMPDEPARHKLLDLVGDLYRIGGPPLGRLHAVRPGHAATSRAIQRALDEGILAAG